MPPSAAIRGRARAPRGTRGSDPSPASRPALDPKPDGRCAVDASPGPARDARPGSPLRAPWALPTPRPRRCGSSWARPAVSIPRGHGRGPPAGRLVAPSPRPPARLRAAALCDLGRAPGPLSASVSPSCKWVPAGHFTGCGEKLPRRC